MEHKCHFSGYATRNDLLCGDGRTIRKDAFKGCDGIKVPIVWNHEHNDPNAVLGHAILENRADGVYAYGTFNDEPQGRHAHALVKHGDVRALSIWANQLKQIGGDVIHGVIRELSLVLAGANPGAYIDFVMAHSDESGDELYANYDENALVIYHSADDEIVKKPAEESVEEPAEKPAEESVEEPIQHSDESTTKKETTPVENTSKEKTIKEVFDTLNEEQKTLLYGLVGGVVGDDIHDDEESKDDVVEHSATNGRTVKEVFDTLNEEQKQLFYFIIGSAVEDKDSEDETNKNIKHNESEGGNETMKKNAFDKTDVQAEKFVLSHADQEMILKNAKETGVGSLKKAISMYLESQESLSHGLDLGDTEVLNELLPDHKLLNPGAPEVLRDFDQSWVMGVINKIHKSPYSRIRTRKADARAKDLKAKGYKKGEEKKLTEHIKLLGRKTEPTTVYQKDELNRDDIIDITDFDVVAYIWQLMKDNMYETLALAALIGDGREDTDPDKISETNIRPIWKDDEFYTIHRDVDIEAARTELQGSNTGANFGENYIYAEAIITAALYSREKFKGSGTPTLYCAPHLVNVMLLARDLNGRRIYDSKADLARALNVAAIVEIEQLEGKTREDGEGNTKKLLGLFVNLADYSFGSTKGGEITKFDDFDIDFNKYKYLMETRLSGALTEPFSAIALEEPVNA